MASSPEPRSRRFLLEGLVIVASILLAFGIEAGWGELQEERDAAELASAMLSDVRASRTNLDTMTSRVERKVEASMEVRNLLRSPTPAVPMDTLNVMLLESLYIDRTAPVLNAYQQLVARGLLARLHPEVGVALSEWLQRQADAGAYGEQDMLDYRQSVVFPFLSGPPMSGEDIMRHYLDLGEFGEPRFEHTWGELHRSRELASILVTQAATARSLLDQYQRLDSSAVVLENALMRHYRDPAQPSRD